MLNTLIYLEANNYLHRDISIDFSEIPNDLITVSDGPINFTVNSSTRESESQDFEEVSSSLDNYMQASNESLIADNSVFDIAPGEENETKSFLHDENREELVFPSLFLDGKFGS